jgi:hypothetical protein
MTLSYDRLNTRNRDKFGVNVTYTPAGGVGRTVKAILDRDYFSDTGGVGIQTESFVVQLVDADVPELAAGDGVTYGGVNYTAVEVKPDFHGMTDVVLNKA